MTSSPIFFALLESLYMNLKRKKKMSKVIDFLTGKTSLNISQQVELKSILKVEVPDIITSRIILSKFIEFAKSISSEVMVEGLDETVFLDNMVSEINGLGNLSNIILPKVTDKEREDYLVSFRNFAYSIMSKRDKCSKKDAVRLVCTVDRSCKRVITDQSLLLDYSIFGKKNLLIIIDMQLDFTEGNLIVPGGKEAENNLIRWINMNRSQIDSILLTRDDHFPSHIGMAYSWKDKSGNTVEPFTTISSNQVENGTYVNSVLSKEVVLGYLKRIESLGYTHTVWPLHCIRGSKGQQFSEDLINALRWWSYSKSGSHYIVMDKGEKDDSEMYSIFSYVDGYDPEYTKNLLGNIADAGFDKIFISGLAKDYCVAYSVKDLLGDSRFNGKLVFLNNCMSSIKSDSPSNKIFEEAVKNYNDKIL